MMFVERIALPSINMTEVLNVPYHYQKPVERLGIASSIFMCLEFFDNKYRKLEITDNMPLANCFKVICDLTGTNEQGGTKLPGDLINDLNNQISGLKFHIEEDCTINDLQSKFKENIPTIVLYDHSLLMGGKGESKHAAVVTGFYEYRIILNDPLEGNFWPVSLTKFLPAWEHNLCKAILIEDLGRGQG